MQDEAHGAMTQPAMAVVKEDRGWRLVRVHGEDTIAQPAGGEPRRTTQS